MCSAREYVAAFEWLGWALDRRPEDVHLRSRVGYLQLAVGDLAAAATTFRVSFCLARFNRRLKR